MAEQMACDFLKAKGLRIIEKNFRTRRGEIDLIMQDNETLVFVEVRYRRQNRFGGPEETITASKCARILSAATTWLQEHHGGQEPPARFDAITLTPDVDAKYGYRIHWLKNIIQ